MGKQLSNQSAYTNTNTKNGHQPYNRTPSIVIEHTVVDETDGKHTAKDLADKYGISSATLRTRWFPWLTKAISEDRLKVKGRYTDLAKHLFDDYNLSVTKTDKADQENWVKRITAKFPPIEVLEPEIEDEDPSEIDSKDNSALALIKKESSDLATKTDNVSARIELKTNKRDALLDLLSASVSDKDVLSEDAIEQQLQEQELDAELNAIARVLRINAADKRGEKMAKDILSNQAKK